MAPTNCPVFKSCKLSLEIAAILTITLVIKIANAVANIVPLGILNTLNASLSPNTTKEDTIIPRIPIPEMGLAEVPISPAI